MSDALDQIESPIEQQISQPVQSDSQRDQNWRAMRDKADSAERERSARIQAEQRAADLEKQLAAAKAGGMLADDDLVEGRQFNQKMKDIDQLRNDIAMIAVQQKHQDFYNVVTDEMIEKVSQSKPHLYRSILSNPNIKERCEAMYDVASQLKNAEKYADQDKRIAENLTKPRNSAIVGPQVSTSPLSTFSDGERRSLSRADKEAVRERVNRIMKRN